MVEDVDAVLAVCRDLLGRVDLAIETQLDLVDECAVLLVKDAQKVAVVEDDIVLRWDDLTRVRVGLFLVRKAVVDGEGADLLAVRAVHMEGVRPLVRRAAIGGDGGDVEAVCIRPEEECLILLIFLLVLVEGCKLRLREDGLQVFDPLFGDRAHLDVLRLQGIAARVDVRCAAHCAHDVRLAALALRHGRAVIGADLLAELVVDVRSVRCDRLRRENAEILPGCDRAVLHAQLHQMLLLIARGVEFARIDGILRHGEIGRCVHHVGETLALVLVDRYVLTVEFDLSDGFLRRGECGVFSAAANADAAACAVTAAAGEDRAEEGGGRSRREQRFPLLHFGFLL